MHIIQRSAVVLMWPALVLFGAACDGKDAPMETAAPAAGPDLSATSTDGGGRFLLGGSAQLAQDPENPANQVIRINTTLAPGQCVPTTVPAYQNCPSGTVSRTVNTKIDKLDNMLEFKAWFDAGYVTGGPPKTCGGGSPRIQLAIDLDGDGDSDGNAFGYYGAAPSFVACPVETWLYEDFTGPGDFFITGQPMTPSTGYAFPNEEFEWDVTQFTNCPTPTMQQPTCPPRLVIVPNNFVSPWSVIEAAISTQFPNHKVCTVALVDDAYTGSPGGGGIAYYDLFSAGNETWTDGSDIAGRGFARGCAREDHGDDHHDGDLDDDHDHNHHDDDYDHNRHEHWKDRD